MRAQDTWITLDSGRKLFVSVSAAQDGLPVLLLNSLAADCSMWHGVRTGLRRRSIAFDMRGHGASDILPGSATLADLAADAFAVMDAVGLDRAVLCGLSLGGLTAMEMAAQAPGRVAGLVLANTAVTFPPSTMWLERAATARAGGWPDLVQPTLERWLTPGFRQVQPTTARRVRSMLETLPPEGYAAACSALVTGDGTAALQGYDGPVQLIAGMHDASTPVARAQQMQMLAPQAELVVLDAAHVSAIEQAEEFAAVLERFAAAQEKKESGSAGRHVGSAGR
jgi:3-oxoadipate enol-lactonase